MCLEKDNRIKNVIEIAINCANDLFNENAIVGKPYNLENGDIVFPVSKIFATVLSGGGEYGKTGLFKKANDLPYSVGSGTAVSVNPCGFLVKTVEGDYKFLSIGECKYDAIIDKAADFLEKITVNNE